MAYYRGNDPDPGDAFGVDGDRSGELSGEEFGHQQHRVEGVRLDVGGSQRQARRLDGLG